MVDELRPVVSMTGRDQSDSELSVASIYMFLLQQQKKHPGWDAPEIYQHRRYFDVVMMRDSRVGITSMWVRLAIRRGKLPFWEYSWLNAYSWLAVVVNLPRYIRQYRRYLASDEVTTELTCDHITDTQSSHMTTLRDARNDVRTVINNRVEMESEVTRLLLNFDDPDQ